MHVQAEGPHARCSVCGQTGTEHRVWSLTPAREWGTSLWTRGSVIPRPVHLAGFPSKIHFSVAQASGVTRPALPQSHWPLWAPHLSWVKSQASGLLWGPGSQQAGARWALAVLCEEGFHKLTDSASLHPGTGPPRGFLLPGQVALPWWPLRVIDLGRGSPRRPLKLGQTHNEAEKGLWTSLRLVGEEAVTSPEERQRVSGLPGMQGQDAGSQGAGVGQEAGAASPQGRPVRLQKNTGVCISFSFSASAGSGS